MGQMLASKIAYSARNSKNRINPSPSNQETAYSLLVQLMYQRMWVVARDQSTLSIDKGWITSEMV